MSLSVLSTVTEHPVISSEVMWLPTRLRATVTPDLLRIAATSPNMRYSSSRGVPPMPLSMTITGEPTKSRSRRIGSTSCAAMSRAVPVGTRVRPGSPWIPTPSSISPSGRSKVGLPAAGTVQDVRAIPIDRPDSLIRRASAAICARSCPASAAAPTIFSSRTVTPTTRGPEGVLHGNIIVGHDRFHRHAGFTCGKLGGHLEVQDVTRVVLHDVENPGTAVDLLCCLQHLVGRGGSEHLTGARGIQHSITDKASVQRFVAAATAGD